MLKAIICASTIASSILFSHVVSIFQLQSCKTKWLNLQNCPYYISGYRENWPGNIIDNDYCNWFHSDYYGGGLDNGIEWFIVNINIQPIQIVHTVSIIGRNNQLARNADIDIMLANTMSKTLVSMSGEKNIPWSNFVTCGKTPSTTTQKRVDVQCVPAINTRFLGLKRLYNSYAYCCLNFNELLVSVLELYEGVPMLDHSDLIEGSSHVIGTGCSLPTSMAIKTVWYESELNGTSKLLTQQGDQIIFNNVTRQSPKKYHYVHLDTTLGVKLVTSALSEIVQVRYCADIITLTTIYEVKEDTIFNISCTSNAGHPYPTLMLELDNMVYYSNLTGNDIYGGRSASSYLSLVAQLIWNGKTVKCTRIQNGFPNITRSFVLSVQSKNESIVFNTTSPTSVNKTLEINERFSYDLSSYIISVNPDQLNISCSESGTVYFAMYLKSYKDLKITLLSNGSFLCTIIHKISQKTILINLSINNQIKYATDIVNFPPNYEVIEDSVININCASNAGNPYPQILLEFENLVGNFSMGDLDSFGERLAYSNLSIVAQKDWTGKAIKCTRIQSGFPNITKIATLLIRSKNEFVLFHSTFPATVKKTLQLNEKFVFNLSSYIVSASPDEFNISCTESETVYFAMHLKSHKNLSLKFFSNGSYVCVLDHKVNQKIILFHLKDGTSSKAGIQELLIISLGGIACSEFLLIITIFVMKYLGK